MSAIVRFDIANRRLAQTSVLPVWIDRDAVPRVLTASDERFEQVAKYLRDVTAEAELNAQFIAKADQLLVGASV